MDRSNVQYFQASARKAVYKKNGEECCFALFMHPDQKNTVWMKNIVQKCTKPENLEMHACAGSLSFIKVSMLLPIYRTLVGCEVDPDCVTQTMARLILLNS